MSFFGHEIRFNAEHKRTLVDVTAGEKNLVNCICCCV